MYVVYRAPEIDKEQLEIEKRARRDRIRRGICGTLALMGLALLIGIAGAVELGTITEGKFIIHLCVAVSCAIVGIVGIYEG